MQVRAELCVEFLCLTMRLAGCALLLPLHVMAETFATVLFTKVSLLQVCVPTFSHNHVSPIRDPVEELKEKDSRHLQKGC